MMLRSLIRQCDLAIEHGNTQRRGSELLRLPQARAGVFDSRRSLPPCAGVLRSFGCPTGQLWGVRIRFESF